MSERARRAAGSSTRDDATGRKARGAWSRDSVEEGETAEAAAVREVEEETGLRGRSPGLLRTIAQRDLVLICVEVEIDDEAPRAAADAEEVRLTHPDRGLTPEDWPARQLVEELLAD